VIDVGTREQRLFIGDQLGDVPGHLDAFDFLAGLDLRPSLREVGLAPDRRWPGRCAVTPTSRRS
jgi:hypothetical protein